MVVSSVKASFSCEVEKIWDIVTSLDNYSWRKNLSKIEILEDGRQFVEYTTDGFSTKFTITACEPYERYEFDMENENMEGHWVGIFSGKNGETFIHFTEIVTTKKWYMRPFVGIYLKRQQASYLADLTKALENLV